MVTNMLEMHFRTAAEADIPNLQSLLGELGLPCEDLRTSKPEVVVAEQGGLIVGCVGIESFDRFGLLRSLAVRKDRQGHGIGAALFERAIARASDKGMECLFLLTMTAEAFFARRGFMKVERSRVPERVAASAEFASLCPASAVTMMLAVASSRDTMRETR